MKNHPFDFFFQWHLTERCNLRCSHCYQNGHEGDDLSFEESVDFIDECADLLRSWSASYGVDFRPSFNITGGEPLLQENLPSILNLLRENGFSIYLLTNGTLIDRWWADLLKKSSVSGVQISLEGTQKVHEAIRGRGSFDAAICGVNHVLDTGLPVTLNLTLSEINAPCLDDMIDLAIDLGVQRLGFSRLVPSGRGCDLEDRMLPAEKFEAICRDLFALDLSGLEIVTGDPVAACLRNDTIEKDGDFPLGGCSAGVSGLTILPDGTVLPCRRLEVPLGNIRRDSLREIWSESEVLAALRDKTRYGGNCGRCEKWALCRGCRAIAYASSANLGRADYLAHDPQCFF